MTMFIWVDMYRTLSMYYTALLFVKVKTPFGLANLKNHISIIPEKKEQ